VPTGLNDPLVSYDSATTANTLDSLINSTKLNKYRGGVAPRNAFNSKWFTRLDLHVSQEIPTGLGQSRITLFGDIENFTNLLNKKWGRINEVGFQTNGGQARSFVDFAGVDPASGKYIYRLRDVVEPFDVRQVKGESQWAMQATFKYEF